uniref:Thioredoxin domain-containing protein 17 n=1 Tax=Mesocestoides corti TaxID=53468 RepID=A0A5K3ETN1_MESCO
MLINGGFLTDADAYFFSLIMPATQIYLSSRDEVEEKLSEIFASKSGQRVVLLFEGSTDFATGDSWDESCRTVETLLEPLLNAAPETTIFLMAEVGREDEWNDSANFFKRHDTYKVTSLPTLLLLTGATTVSKRLEGEACLNKDALAEFFN